MTPPPRFAPIIATAPSVSTKPDSAAAAASAASRTAKRTPQQKQEGERIPMLSKQIAEVKRLFDKGKGKRVEHKDVLEEMQREMVWSRDQEPGGCVGPGVG